MKKIIQSLREEIIPLSSRQNLALFVVIACIFQFLFFFAPTLAKAAVEEALAEETEIMVSNGAILKMKILTKKQLNLCLKMKVLAF
jgi:hypothetical protein